MTKSVIGKFVTFIAMAIISMSSTLFCFTNTAHAEYADGTSDTVTSSNPFNPSTISVELLGRGGVYSFDYDKMVSDSVALGVGLSYFSVSLFETNVSAVIIPVYVNYYFSTTPSRGFLTGGADIVVASASDRSGIGLGSFTGTGAAGVVGGGYEYRGTSGFLFRAAPYLIVGTGGIAITAGFSFGVAF